MLTELPALMVKMMLAVTKLNKLDFLLLEQEVIRLYNVARTLEQIFDSSEEKLIGDIRQCADSLSELLKKN